MYGHVVEIARRNNREREAAYRRLRHVSTATWWSDEYVGYHLARQANKVAQLRRALETRIDTLMKAAGKDFSWQHPTTARSPALEHLSEISATRLPDPLSGAGLEEALRVRRRRATGWIPPTLFASTIGPGIASGAAEVDGRLMPVAVTGAVVGTVAPPTMWFSVLRRLYGLERAVRYTDAARSLGDAITFLIEREQEGLRLTTDLPPEFLEPGVPEPGLWDEDDRVQVTWERLVGICERFPDLHEAVERDLRRERTTADRAARNSDANGLTT